MTSSINCTRNVYELERIINYTFRDKAWAVRALATKPVKAVVYGQTCLITDVWSEFPAWGFTAVMDTLRDKWATAKRSEGCWNLIKRDLLGDDEFIVKAKVLGIAEILITGPCADDEPSQESMGKAAKAVVAAVGCDGGTEARAKVIKTFGFWHWACMTDEELAQARIDPVWQEQNDTLLEGSDSSRDSSTVKGSPIQGTSPINGLISVEEGRLTEENSSVVESKIVEDCLIDLDIE